MTKTVLKNKGFTPTPICIVSANEESNCVADWGIISLRRRCANRCGGFTIAELLMAVWVMSIILAAVATLSFVLGNASDSADDTSEIQSRVRYTTIYLSELVRYSKLIRADLGNGVAVWRDYNDDSRIEPNEIVYIESGSNNNCIELVSFTPSGVATPPVILISGCSYVTFKTDQPPPFTKMLNISFGVSNNGSVENYQISNYLRCYAGYLLDGSGQIDPNDDDM